MKEKDKPLDKRNNNQYDISKIANRYFKLGRNLKEGNVTQEYVHKQFKDDVDFFVQMKTVDKITEVEFDSIMNMIYESEGILAHIMNKINDVDVSDLKDNPDDFKGFAQFQNGETGKEGIEIRYDGKVN